MVASVLLASGARPAAAHASLQSTSPSADELLSAAPSEITLEFDGGVSADLGGVRVFGPDGTRVDRGRVESDRDGQLVIAPMDGQDEGTYTVAWRVTSNDGHVLEGSFLFHVGVRTSATPVALSDDRPLLDLAAWLSRFASFAAMCVVGGVVVVWLTQPQRRVPRENRSRRLHLVAAGLLVLATVLRMLTQVAGASGRTFPAAIGLLGEAVTATRAGQLDLLRVGGALVTLTATAFGRRSVAATLSFVGLAAVLAANALAGHAWTSGHRAVAVAVDIAHQSAAIVWVGGLAVLVLLSLRNDRDLLRRFSAVALASVGAVAITGGVSAWLQIRSTDVVWSTGYGRFVLAKAGVVLVMVVLGWFHRRQVAEALSVSRNGFSLRAEALAGAAVLALTASLVAQVPARQSIDEPFSTNVIDDAGPVSITVDPASVGSNTLHLYFFDESGAPRPVDVAELTVATDDIPSRKVDIYPLAPGHFSTSSVDLPLPGRWRFTVTTVTRGTPSNLSFEVPVR